MKKNTKHLTITAVIIIVFCTILTGGSLYMIDYSLRPINRGKDMSASELYMREKYPQINSWLDSLKNNNLLKDIFITAEDGIKLHAFYAKASRPTKKTAIIVHGYTDNAIRMFHIGYLYNKSLDYNIILPDLRYTGLSGGESIQMGWLDRLDVLKWIKVTPHIFGDSIQTVIHGISMGAATTMMTSGENLSESIKCFIEDCGYTTVWHQFKKELKEQFGLPSFPLLHTASVICNLQNGWSFKEASAIKQVKKCHKPMLFIHGDKDDFVPTYMVYELYEAKPQPKELWIVPDTDHANSYKNFPEEYTNKIKCFTEKYIDKD